MQKMCPSSIKRGFSGAHVCFTYVHLQLLIISFDTFFNVFFLYFSFCVTLTYITEDDNKGEMSGINQLTSCLPVEFFFAGPTTHVAVKAPGSIGRVGKQLLHPPPPPLFVCECMRVCVSLRAQLYI